MDREKIKSIIESLIFAADEPITIQTIETLFQDTEVAKEALREILSELIKEYDASPSRGIRIAEVAGGYQFRTKPENAPWIQKLNLPKPTHLSQAAIETLAIIAYRQPVMKSEIESIRGVDCSGVLRTLLEKGLIRIVGRSNEVGMPLLYGTTKTFLSTFGLSSLSDLPPLESVNGEGSPSSPAQTKLFEDEGEGIRNVISELARLHSNDQINTEDEDERDIEELEDSIKRLCRTEKEIYRNSKTEIVAIRKAEYEGEGAKDNSEGNGDIKEDGRIPNNEREGKD